MTKKLAADSKLNVADTNGDGIITDEELDTQERMIRLENEDKKEDAQRNMAWFALGGMLLYPFAVVIAVVFGVDKAATILGDMAGVYFIAVAGIVAAFFGAAALKAKK
jgi:hypothetical protein